MDIFYGIVTPHPMDEHREPPWYLCAFKLLRAYQSQDELLKKAGRLHCSIEFAPPTSIAELGLKSDSIYLIGTWGSVTELERLFPITTPEIGGFLEITGPPDARTPVGSAGHGTFYVSLDSAQKGATERFRREVTNLVNER